jgi:hypothetical protein
MDDTYQIVETRALTVARVRRRQVILNRPGFAGGSNS